MALMRRRARRRAAQSDRAAHKTDGRLDHLRGHPRQHSPCSLHIPWLGRLTPDTQHLHRLAMRHMSRSWSRGRARCSHRTPTQAVAARTSYFDTARFNTSHGHPRASTHRERVIQLGIPSIMVVKMTMSRRLGVKGERGTLHHRMFKVVPIEGKGHACRVALHPHGRANTCRQPSRPRRDSAAAQDALPH